MPVFAKENFGISEIKGRMNKTFTNSTSTLQHSLPTLGEINHPPKILNAHLCQGKLNEGFDSCLVATATTIRCKPCQSGGGWSGKMLQGISVYCKSCGALACLGPDVLI